MATGFLAACKEKKKPSLSGEEPVEKVDFLEAYSLKKTPLEFNQSILNSRENDSFRISKKVFTQFIPDSVLDKISGKAAKPKIFPLARVVSPDDETYLFSKIVLPGKNHILVSCFDKKQQYGGSLDLIQPVKSSAYEETGGVDARFAFYRTVKMKKPDGSTAEGRDVFSFDAETKSFQLIMTDPVEDRITELINPIDSLPVKSKFAADYTKGKMNLVSIRDAARSGRILFFIHLEQNNGTCTGELRGEAKFISPTKAVYTKPGDVCQLEFIFTTSSVSLKELAACGNWRGVQCSFDGSFAKKKKMVTGKKKK